MADKPYLSAAKEPYNVLAIAGATALSLALLTPIPFLVGAVVEAGYLLFLPESKWYQNRIATRGQSAAQIAQKSKRESLLPTLSPELQDRYRHMESVRGQIQSQVSNQVNFTPEIFTKLDQLLDQFLESGAKDVQLRAHLASLASQSPSDAQPMTLRYYGSSGYAGKGHAQVSRDGAVHSRSQADGNGWVEKTVESIQASYNSELNELDVNGETDPSLKATMQKRIDILHRRNTYVGKLGQAIKNLDQQLKLVEDSFGLINDEVNSSTPDQVLTEIDNLMQQTDSLTQALREIGEMGAESAELRTGS